MRNRKAPRLCPQCEQPLALVPGDEFDVDFLRVRCLSIKDLDPDLLSTAWSRGSMRRSRTFGVSRLTLRTNYARR